MRGNGTRDQTVARVVSRFHANLMSFPPKEITLKASKINVVAQKNGSKEITHSHGVFELHIEKNVRPLDFRFLRHASYPFLRAWVGGPMFGCLLAQSATLRIHP